MTGRRGFLAALLAVPLAPFVRTRGRVEVLAGRRYNMLMAPSVFGLPTGSGLGKISGSCPSSADLGDAFRITNYWH